MTWSFFLSFAIPNAQIGQDRPMSLMDDWGEGDQFPFNLNSLSPVKLSQVAFLFGGVGDGQ